MEENRASTQVNKSTLNKLKGFLNENTPAIQAITTIVLAIFALIAICQTQQLLSQQKKEEFTRLRAYVFAPSMKIFDETVNGIPAYRIAINYKNSGQTPAADLSLKSYFLFKQKKIEELISGTTNLSPQQEVIVNSATILKDKLNTYDFTKDSGNFFVLEYSYKTYQGRCFLNKSLTTLNKVDRPDQNYTLGISKQEEEKETGCKNLISDPHTSN